MSYHDSHAHPVALTRGKVLVEAEWTGERSGNKPVVFTGEWTICADPATVHPASVLEDLRANLAASVAAANRNADRAIKAEQERDAARRELAEALELQAKYNRLLTSAENAICRLTYRECWAQMGDGSQLQDAVTLAQQREEEFERRARIAECALARVEEAMQTDCHDAILARHAQPERRKSERRTNQGMVHPHDLVYYGNRRSKEDSDRRKASVTLDWQARAEDWAAKCDHLREKAERAMCQAHDDRKECQRITELSKVTHERATAAEAECERLRAAIAANNEKHANLPQLSAKPENSWDALFHLAKWLDALWDDDLDDYVQQDLRRIGAELKTMHGELATATTRAEQAEAKLEKVREWKESKLGPHWSLYTQLEEILDTPPPQQQAEPTEWISAVKQFEAIEQLQREIDAIKDAQKARA